MNDILNENMIDLNDIEMDDFDLYLSISENEMIEQSLINDVIMSVPIIDDEIIKKIKDDHIDDLVGNKNDELLNEIEIICLVIENEEKYFNKKKYEEIFMLSPTILEKKLIFEKISVSKINRKENIKKVKKNQDKISKLNKNEIKSINEINEGIIIDDLKIANKAIIHSLEEKYQECTNNLKKHMQERGKRINLLMFNMGFNYLLEGDNVRFERHILYLEDIKFLEIDYSSKLNFVNYFRNQQLFQDENNFLLY